MSVTKLFLAEKLFEDYVKTPPTLKEQALTKLAIELCKDSEMKKHIICTSDPVASNTLFRSDNDNVWKNLIEERSTVMCEILPLPSALQSRLWSRIWWISVELLSWNKQHQALLRTSPELTYQLLMQSDWTVEGRLDEKKIADRLAQDASIDICPRYQLACLYCLEPHIHKLWDQLSPEDQDDMSGEGNQRLYGKLSELVKLWSNHLTGNIDATLRHDSTFWQNLLKAAVTEGASTTVISCWTALSEIKKQDIIMETTLIALTKSIENNDLSTWMDHLIGNRNKHYVRPTYRSDVLYFIFSQMSDEQIVSFFQRKIKVLSQYAYPKLSDAFECLLQWPYQDMFIQFMTKLWDILSEQNYGDILLYITNYGYKICDNKDYDYNGLLIKLLDEAPEKYKQYIFKDKESNIFDELLDQLCRISSLFNRDIRIIQRILQQATAEKKQIFILSSYGEELCFYIIKNECWELIECLLSECMSVVEVAKFKERYVQSNSGKSLYFDLLRRNNGEALNAFLNFGFSSAEEISQFNSKSIFEHQHRFFGYACELKLDFLSKIIQRCLLSDETQKQYMEQYIKTQGMDVCFHFIERSKWDELAQFINWCLPSDEEREKFKQEFFVSKSREICGHLMLGRQWDTAELFFKWHNLSPEAIIQLKKDSLFSCDIFSKFYSLLSEVDELEYIAICLKWVLVDEEAVWACRKVFDEAKFNENNCKDEKHEHLIVQRRWDKLMSDLLRDLSAEGKKKNPQMEDKSREDYYLHKKSRRS